LEVFGIRDVVNLEYSSIAGHENWQIETAVWNLAGFLHCALETRWQRFWQFLNDLSRHLMLDFQDFLLDFRKIASEIQHQIAIFVGNRDFCRKLRFSSEIETKIAKNRVGNPTYNLLQSQSFYGGCKNSLVGMAVS